MMQKKTIYRYVEGWQRGTRARKTNWFENPDRAMIEARKKKLFLPQLESSKIQVPAPMHVQTSEPIGVIFGFPVTREMLEDNCYYCGEQLDDSDDKLLMTCRNCWEA